MTDTKPKDACDTVDYGHAHVGMSVCVCASTKVPESVRGVPFQLRLDDSRVVACIQCRVPRFNFRLSDRGRTVPRIGMCRACHGSRCAVPTTDRDVPCLPRIGAYHAADRDVPCPPRIGVCRACHGSGCAVPAMDRDVPCLPRIGVCRACHESGCAVPAMDRGVPCLLRIGMCRARGTLHHGSRYSMGSKKSGRPRRSSLETGISKAIFKGK